MFNTFLRDGYGQLTQCSSWVKGLASKTSSYWGDCSALFNA